MYCFQLLNVIFWSSLVWNSGVTGFPDCIQLHPKDQADGWRLLFDGCSTEHWTGFRSTRFPDHIWKVEEGYLTVQPNYRWGNDLISREKYLNFELQFEWKIAPGSNSGIKYLVKPNHRDPTRQLVSRWTMWVGIGMLIIGIWILLKKRPHPKDRSPGFTQLLPKAPLLVLLTAFSLLLVSYFLGMPGTASVGLEYQLIDDSNQNQLSDTQIAGALYGLKTPLEKVTHGPGEWNSGRIRVSDGQVEHWLNEHLVLEYELGSPNLINRVQDSKFRNLAGFGSNRGGYICLQNHMSRVWFRKILIRRLSH